MALLATQQITLSGLAATYSAATAGGDTIDCDDRSILHVKNGGGAPITVTITVTAPAPSPLVIGNLVVTVTNGTDKFIGPLTDPIFASTTGLASIAYSAVTTVTVASLRN